LTPPTIAPARPELVTDGVPARRPGWVERVTSGDHKSVGLIYIAAALSFLAVAAVEFALLRIQLIVPESTTINPETFDRVLSTFGVTAVVLSAIPLALGLMSYLVPLQIGGRGVAFPRLNLLSAWLYVGGAVSVYMSFLWRPSEAGLAALPPLSDNVFSPSNGVDAWILGMALAILGFVCFAVNLVVTVGNMRAPGMAWRRLPPFSWAATVSGYVLLVVGPAMLAGLTMLTVDRHFNGIFFDPQQTGAPLLYEHLSWIFFCGAYVMILLFAFGVISEILPTFSRKPLFSHRAAVGSFVATGVLGVLAWMQNMYTAPLPIGVEIFAMLMALALLIPIGLLLLNWVATIWGGTLRLEAASLFALAAISAITFGLGGELMYSVIPVGWQLDNTTAAQQDTMAVIVGAAVLGGFAALHYWFPKLSGRTLGEGLGRIALATIVVGLVVYSVPMFLAGLKGQPVDIYKYFESAGVDGFNLIASIGAFVLVIGVLIGLANAAHSWRNGIPAGHDPWGGATLEWFALSPPPEHNFDAVPDVRSAEPLLDIREAIARRTREWRPPEPLTTPAPPEPQPVAVEPEPDGPSEPASEPEPPVS
jgi:cytochrome c oxidase subunit 1